MNIKYAQIGAAGVMLGIIGTVWAAVVDPRYVRPEHLDAIREQVKSNRLTVEDLQKDANIEIRTIKVSIYEMRIDLINERLMELDALKRQRKLRADEAYQYRDYESKLKRVKRTLQRIES